MLGSSSFLSPYCFPSSEAQRLGEEFLANDSVSAYAHTQVLKDKVKNTIERYYDLLSSFHRRNYCQGEHSSYCR
jgi:hypothetical protein